MDQVPLDPRFVLSTSEAFCALPRCSRRAPSTRLAVRWTQSCARAEDEAIGAFVALQEGSDFE